MPEKNYEVELLDDYIYDSPDDFDGEIDVKIIFESGEEYMVTFITLSTLSKRLKIKDDRHTHNYLLTSNEYVICEMISHQVILEMLEDIIRDEFYWTIFLPCNEKAEDEISVKTEPLSEEEAEKRFEEMENMINKDSKST